MKTLPRISPLFVSLLIAFFLLSLFAYTALADENSDRREVRESMKESILQEVNERLNHEYVVDELIVKYRGDERFRVVRLPRGKSIREAEEEFELDDDVEYAEPNYIAHAFMTPNDTYYSYQWHLDNSVYGGIHAEDAWDIADGSGITVAIVDTGVAYENYGIYGLAPDLAGTAFVAGYDYVNGDSHPNDDEGHGTHVAGTVAQTTNNSSGVAGLAFGAALMPVKVLNQNGSGSYSDVASGIYYAVNNGADVINLSLGGSASSVTLEDAVQYAYSSGVTVVAAAGNDGSGSVSYPAAYDNYVIAVGATRFDETKAPYSNYGSSLDIAAPGGDLNVDQNGDGYGDGVLQQTFSGSPSNFGYYFYQGTSMATPHVAAAAALVISNGGASTPDEVRDALESTADDLGAPGRDNTYGWGLLNVPAALAYTTGSPPPPGPEQETIFFDDFAGSPFQNWTESNEFDWTIERPAERNIPGYPSGNTVAHADNCDSYCVLTLSDPLDLTGYEDVTLSFWRYVDRGLDNNEYLKVEIFDGGSWNQVFYWTNGSGDDDRWHKETLNLPGGYLVNNFSVRFTSRESSSSEETELDDVTIAGVPLVLGNQPPIADAGPDLSVSDADNTGGENVTLDGSSSYDPDGTITSYEWKEGATVLGTTETISHVFSLGDHTVTLTVIDNEGETGSDTTNISVLANQSPTADAGPDQTIMDSDDNGSEMVVLSGSGSDPDGVISSYEWKEGAMVLSDQASTTVELSVGTHTITFTATDNGGATGSDTTVVTVSPYTNQTPVADAGPDQSVLVGEEVSFDGSGSSDPDGSIVSYDWDFGDSNTGAGATPNHTYAAAGDYTVTLTVTDNGGLTSEDSLQVTVSEQQSEVEVFYDSFEVAGEEELEDWNGLWTQDSQNDWRVNDQRAVEGGWSAEVDGLANDAGLTSISIDLQGRTNATITFSWLLENRVGRNEYVAFDVSLNGGSSWQELSRLQGNDAEEDVWHNESVELTGINSLQIRFRGYMSRSNEDANVDAVRVVAW